MSSARPTRWNTTSSTARSGVYRWRSRTTSTYAANPRRPARHFCKTTFASADAHAVERLRAAGALICGKTNLHEFAYGATGANPHHGTPRNPVDANRVPG